MRMVRLPRRHKNSVPSWVDVTTFQSRAGRSAEGSVSNVASNTAALRSQAEFKPRRGWRAIRRIFDFQLAILIWHQHLSSNGRKQLAIGNRNLAML